MSNERIYKCETEGIVSREYDVATLGLDAEELGAAHTALQKAGLVDEGWSLLMALEVPSHMVHTIMGRWKRESRGSESRITKGLKLADEYMTPVHISNQPIGVLEELNELPSKDGKKIVSDRFWKNL